MADSVTPTDKEEDREKTFEDLRTALDKNQDSYCKDIASYSSKNSSEPRDEHHCILGPYFIDKIPIAVLVALLRAHQNEKIFVGRGVSRTMSAKLEQQWPLSNEPEWPEWVARVESSAYAYHWKRAGIYDAIGMSTCNMPFDHPLVTSGLCFWNSATNTMDLPGLGMMSPTLLDVEAITGFKVHGQEVSALTIPPPQILKLNGVDLSYSKFIQHFMGKKDQQVTMEEHIAFLLYWLCKYIFCVASLKVTEEWAGLAEALTSYDNNLALGPVLLAHLYRGLREMTQQPLAGNSYGPIWLFQMWLQLYFPELAPPHVSYYKHKILGASLVGVTLPEHTPEQCFNVFYQCTSRTDDQWSVCFNRDYPSVFLFRPSSYSSDPSSNDAKDLILSFMCNSVRASVLTTRDLHLGVKVGSKTYCGAELYCPNHFSRQLGCLQYFPVPVLSSVNRYSSWRKQFKEKSEVAELSKYSESKCREFKNQPWTMTYKSSSNFKTWQMTITCLDIIHKFGDYSCSPNRDARLHSTSQPPSSSGSLLPSKATQSNGTPDIEVIIPEDIEEDGDEIHISKRPRRCKDIQDKPPGFEQVRGLQQGVLDHATASNTLAKSTGQSSPSATGIPPLQSSGLKNIKASFPSEMIDAASTARNDVLTFLNTSLSYLVDMDEGFNRFKTAIQSLVNSGDVSSIDIPVLQSQLQELEARLPDFRAAKREPTSVDEGLALLPYATSKMESSLKQCSEIDDRVKKLNTRLAELEAETAQVKTERDQALGELKLELESRAPIQQILDRANELKAKKTEVETRMSKTIEPYDTIKGSLKAQLGLNNVKAET